MVYPLRACTRSLSFAALYGLVACVALLPLSLQAQGPRCEDATELRFGTDDRACPPQTFDNLFAGDSRINLGANSSCLTRSASLEVSDVWFTFVPTREVVEISVQAAGTNPLPEPQFLVLRGSCTSFTFVGCSSDLFGTGEEASVVYGLTPGERYYLLVSGGFGEEGEFNVCLEQRDAVTGPGQDCGTAPLVCDETQTIVVDATYGPGDVLRETTGDGCFGGFEVSSSWHKWTADGDGSLVFTITPDDKFDDFDFVLYELAGAPDDCTFARTLACMTSGPNVGEPRTEWEACTNQTGMSVSGGGSSEDVGCQPGDDNFVGSIEMRDGVSYALIVVNATQSGLGYTLDFNGTTGAFGSPNLNFDLEVRSQDCDEVVVDITYTGEGDVLDTQISWDFGPNASPRLVDGKDVPPITFSQGGTQRIDLIYSGGCDLRSTFERTLPEIGGAITLDTVDVVRPGCGRAGIVTLAPSIPGDYSYSYVVRGSSSPSPEQPTGIFAGLSAGEYVFRAINGAGCRATIPVSLQSADVTFGPITIDTIRGTCPATGSTVVVTASGVNGIPTYELKGFGEQVESTFSDVPGGTYELIVREPGVCTFVTEVTVPSVSGGPTAERAVVTDASCAEATNGSIRLIGLDAGDGADVADLTYSLNGGVPQDSAVFRDLPAGEYSLTVQTPAGCSTALVIAVPAGDEQPDLPAPTLTPTTCAAGSDGAIVLEGDFVGWQFRLDDSEPTAAARFGGLAAGTYSVSATDASGCSVVAEFDVAAGDPGVGVIDLGPARAVRFGESLTLTAGLGESFDYAWLAADSVRCATASCEAIELTVTQFQNVSVRAVSPDGCALEGRVVVNVRAEEFVGLPTAFSPNGDDLNDVWRPIPSAAVERIDRVTVFDRWGAVVARGVASPGLEPPGWNGRVGSGEEAGGDEVRPGVYVVLVEVTLRNGESRTVSGDVTLVR